jgi:hypothetical protein
MFKSRCFTRESTGMTDAEFKKASESLMEKGLLEKVLINGKALYRATGRGAVVWTHMHSEVGTRN